MKSYIPDWIAPIKNDWLTAGQFDGIFRIKNDLILAGGLIRKLRLPHKKIASTGAAGFKNLYQVKEVIARLSAHGYEIDKPIEIKKVESKTVFIKDQPPSIKEARLLSEISSLKNEIQNLEKKLNENFDEANKFAMMLLKAKQPSHDMGVYFLCDPQKIVYVGMSATSVSKRIEGRANLMDSVKMIKCGTKQECLFLEKLFIKFLRPVGNTQHNEGKIAA